MTYDQSNLGVFLVILVRIRLFVEKRFFWYSNVFLNPKKSGFPLFLIKSEFAKERRSSLILFHYIFIGARLVFKFKISRQVQVRTNLSTLSN